MYKKFIARYNYPKNITTKKFIIKKTISWKEILVETFITEQV